MRIHIRILVLKEKDGGANPYSVTPLAIFSKDFDISPDCLPATNDRIGGAFPHLSFYAPKVFKRDSALLPQPYDPSNYAWFVETVTTEQFIHDFCADKKNGWSKDK